MRWSLRRQTPQIEDIRDWQDSIEPTVQQQNEETVRCKSTRKLALTLYSDKANQSVQTRIYVRRTRPTNPYKQDIYTLSSVQTSLLRVNRSNMIYRVTSYSKKKKKKKQLITWSKRTGNKKTRTPTATSVLQINYLPQLSASANNWSARRWQIAIFCLTSSNNC